MTREHYVSTETLRVRARLAGELYEDTQNLEHLATEQAYRDELTRRHRLNWCDPCGFPGEDCMCGDTASGPNVVYLDEYEHEGAA